MLRGEASPSPTKMASFIYAYVIDSFDNANQVKVADAILEGSIAWDSPEVEQFIRSRCERYLESCRLLYSTDNVKTAEDLFIKDLIEAKELRLNLPDEILTIASFNKMAEDSNSEGVKSLSLEDFIALLLGSPMTSGGVNYNVEPKIRVLAAIGLPLALIGFINALSGKTSGLLMSILGGVMLYGVYSTLNDAYRNLQMGITPEKAQQRADQQKKIQNVAYNQGTSASDLKGTDARNQEALLAMRQRTPAPLAPPSPQPPGPAPLRPPAEQIAATPTPTPPPPVGQEDILSNIAKSKPPMPSNELQLPA